MLRNLLRKDLLMNARHFWGFAPFFLWVAYAVSEPGLLEMNTLVAAFAGTLVATTVVAREDKFHATALLYSLPVRRREVVLSRYVVALLTGIVSFLIATTMAVVLPWSPHDLARIFDLRSVLFMLVLVGATIAVMMPFVLRFGLIGVMIFMLVFQVAGMVAFVLTAAFGRSNSLRPVIKAVEQTLTGLYHRLDTPLVAATAACVVAATIWMSYRLSVVMAERRDT